MAMLNFVLRRLLHAVPLLICVIVFNFFLIHLAPGDPIQALVGEFPAPEAYITEMRKTFGLDLYRVATEGKVLLPRPSR